MKKLSIEEKAKRYDIAIELVNSKWHYKNQPCIIDVSEIFPELKKSEDETIRKALLEIVNDTKGDDLWINYNVHKEDVIAWLEKQTEQKTCITQYCCILNYNTGKVFKHCITEDEVNLNTVELLRKYGFKESECSVMYASNNLELELLKD